MKEPYFFLLHSEWPAPSATGAGQEIWPPTPIHKTREAQYWEPYEKEA